MTPAAAKADDTNVLDLFPATADVKAGTKEEFTHLDIESIEPDPEQPRKDADSDLEASIRQEGVLQPITVRPHPDAAKVKAGTRYMIVYGERRYWGSLKAGRSTIPAIVRPELGEDRVRRLIRQLQENHHKALAPLEEAIVLREARDVAKLSVNQLAEITGKPKSTISDRLALADAPAAFQPLFAKGTLSAAAAPVLRKFSEVPPKILQKAVELAQENYDWEDAIRDHKAIEIRDVERVLDEIILTEELREVPDVLALHYQGETCKIGGKTYATEVAKFEKIAAKHQADIDLAEKAKNKGKKTSSTPSAPRHKKTDAEKKAEAKELADKEARKVDDTRWKKAHQALREAIAAAIKKAPADGRSAIADYLLEEGQGYYQGAGREVEKLLPRGKSAEDLLRFMVMCDIDGDIRGACEPTTFHNKHYHERERLPRKLAKLKLKIDMRAIVDVIAPLAAPEKVEPKAVAKPAKKPKKKPAKKAAKKPKKKPAKKAAKKKKGGKK